MLDELLGRAALKDRIEELEAESESLRNRLEAEQERRADAVSDRQRAEERNNRLEDRITELEDRVSRLQGDEEEVSARRRETVGGERLREVLSRLRSVETDPEGALTAAVDDAVPEAVSDAVGDRVPVVRRAAPCVVCADDAGLVAAVLEPPRQPASFTEWSDGFRLADEWFLPQAGQHVALVRSDLFALGRFDGSSWSVVDSLESDVMNNHSKGGFSQGRFERRRDAQVDEHLDAAHALLDDHEVGGDLVCLGERTVLGAFEDRAAHRARSDASGDADEAFHDAVHEFYTTRLTSL